MTKRKLGRNNTTKQHPMKKRKNPRTPPVKKAVGRPKSDQPARLEKVTMPVTIEEKAELARVAEAAGKTVAGYVRGKVFPLR